MSRWLTRTQALAVLGLIFVLMGCGSSGKRGGPKTLVTGKIEPRHFQH